MSEQERIAYWEAADRIDELEAKVAELEEKYTASQANYKDAMTLCEEHMVQQSKIKRLEAEIERLRDIAGDRLDAAEGHVRNYQAKVAELEAENLRLRDMLRRVHRQLGLGMSLAGEVELSKLIIEVLKQGE